MFFSEEKNQKTFESAPASAYRPWPGCWERRRNKSFLVLFFKKEHTYFLSQGVSHVAMPAAQLCVLHYTGHRMSGADTHTALLPAAEAKVYEAICALLDTLNIAAAYGSLSSGADTLFAEALLARGAPLHLHFPFALDQFKVLSVLPSGADWGARFDRIVANSGSVSVLASADDPEHGYAACAQAAMEAARAAAGRLHARPLQIACWDGKPSDRQAGTAADVAAWRAAGLATRLVNPQ